ncbi:MAG: hypothetical protein JWM47_3495 [Acidimicrobiales bacterium]|nr:hypothetical protein [Acidimicrobiales bacterium]
MGLKLTGPRTSGNREPKRAARHTGGMRLLLRLLTSDPVAAPLLSSLLGTVALIVAVLAAVLALIGRLTATRLVVQQR